jgi:ribonuclease R
VLDRRGRFMVVEPLFERGRRVTVDVRRRNAPVGRMVLVRIGHKGRAQRPEVVGVLGRPDIARDVVEALLVERGYKRRFPTRVDKDARDAANAPDPERRQDLTALPIFTIDPAEARDFDDAVSVEPDGDGLRLYVHIADVAAHVKPGSGLDGEALRRGNSVYVPGTVEPMLPHALSSDACSLVPGAPRKAVTVELKLDLQSRVKTASFYRSVIRSDARLTYDQVDQIFRGQQDAPDSISEPLSRARRVAADLRRRRLDRGALTIETSEPEFEFDSEGHVVHALDDVQTEAHGLIEELMILANEQVAQTLEQARKATLYRVHEQPEPAAIKFLTTQLESLDVPTPPIPDHMTPRMAAEAVGAIGAAVVEHVKRVGRGQAALTSLVLRSLKPAYYSARNLGHAGLASSAYTHFTSPIRRYPDLVVHRSLLAAVGAGEEAPPAHELDEVGLHCSQTEREAMHLERDADDVCLAFLLERQLLEGGWDRVFEGEVSGLIGGGAFIGLPVKGMAGEPAPLVEGFLPARRLRGEFFELNQERTAMVGQRTGKRLRLGDPLSVRVRSVDPPRNRVELVPAEGEGAQGL